MIKKKKITNPEIYTTHDENFVPKYGLPKKVSYCKNCLMSNQRPNMCAEHKHNYDTKKSTINFNDNDFCDACLLSKKKRILTGRKEKLS